MNCKQAAQLTRDTTWRGRKTEAELYGRCMMALEAADAVTLDVGLLKTVDLARAQAELLAQGRKPATVNRILSALGTVLETARQAGVATCGLPRTLREGGMEPTVFTEDQIERLFTGWDGECATLAEFLLGTGLRVGEALVCRWDQLETDGDGIPTALDLVREKSGRIDKIPLGPTAKQAVLDQAELCDLNLFHHGLKTERATELCGLMFEFGYRDFLDAWSMRVRDKLGKYDGRAHGPHALRRTFATRLHRKGVNLVVIQRLLGHANIRTTTRYIGVTMDEKREAVGS